MLYLLSAIAASAAVSIVMRMSETYAGNTMAMFSANYAVCLAMSRFYMGTIRPLTHQSGIGKAVILGTVSGFLYLACFVLLLILAALVMLSI